MTPLEEFLKKQEIENPESLDYVLQFDESPDPDKYGAILQRFKNPDNPEEYNLETWVQFEGDNKPTLIFYTDQKAHQIFGEENMMSIFGDLIEYYDDAEKNEQRLEYIYSNFEIH